MARLACFTGGADPYRVPWNRLLAATKYTTHVMVRGGHIHIAAGTAPLPVRSAGEPGNLAPPDGQAWDLLVIGGGTAGIVGAKAAAGLGASVLLVERARTGGDCLWTGCVPNEALLAAAHADADARARPGTGPTSKRIEVDFPAVMTHVQPRSR